MFKLAMISALSISLLAGCAGRVSGNFCDIYERVTLSEDSARAIIRDDRPAAIAIAVNESLYQRQCRG
jgi:hypothetical protein